MQDLFQQNMHDDIEINLDHVVSVLVPYPVDKSYSYAVPDDITLQIGDYVCVPLGNREVIGVVWSMEPLEEVNPKKIKSILTKYDCHPMPELQRKFIDWVARYTMSQKGSVLKMALASEAALNKPKPMTGYVLTASAKQNMENAGYLQQFPPKQQAVLKLMADEQTRRAVEIKEECGGTPAVVKSLTGKGQLRQVDIFTASPCRKPNPYDSNVELSPDQQNAADTISAMVKNKEHHVALIDGVTGAGKTEVYFEAVAEALKQDQQVLILVPEITLTNAFLDRFKKRFGCAPALWHSHLTPAQRRTTWRGVAMGETKVVIGARSALFLPYENLGLIVIDEEHDPAYKQEDGVLYHARDMAIVRAFLTKIPVVLVSATPSVETIVNAWDGKYEHLELPDRHGGAELPDMELIDLRADKPERQHFLSPPLKAALAENFKNAEQSLLFLNRRGYAPLTLCRTCGHRMQCPRCTSWLVEHRYKNKLECHHCGYMLPYPDVCPECEDKESLAPCGPGVERILEEVKAYMPQARIAMLASDTTMSNAELKEVLNDIKDHKYDIIVGTQIIAKGHHFPKLTLVGVVDADLGLTGGDLRATERTFQLLHQVAGRAGRTAGHKGRVLLQSWAPESRVMQALVSGDRDHFLEIEAEEREVANMPPYSRLVGIIVSGVDQDQVGEVASALGRCAPHGDGVSTFGPADAPLARIRGKWRKRLLVESDKKINIQKTVAHWLSQVKIPSNVRVYVDIDPQSFL